MFLRGIFYLDENLYSKFSYSNLAQFEVLYNLRDEDFLNFILHMVSSGH